MAGDHPESAYPQRWEADVVLSDGGTVHIRPIRPDDADRLVEFHGRQSAESIFYRYFSPRPRLSPREIERSVNVDYVNRMALVATLGDTLIGVARYDSAPPGPDGSTRAEVAFSVDDRHHGRGLATLLLEHLAQAAVEAGIGGFVATVLPDNRAMITVFRRAGFEVSTSMVDGVVEIDLGIRPTTEGLERIDARARRAEVASVARLLTPATVAVVGAGRRPGSVGHEVLRRLLDGGFNGAVYPVNPATTHVSGVRAYPTVGAIPDEVDLAVLAVPMDAVQAVVEDCARKRVDTVLVIAEGFSGAGDAAVARRRDLVASVRRNGMRLIGPASAGVVNHDPAVRLLATFTPDIPPPGRVALSTQSGSMGGAILAYARETGVGLSAFVNLGDKADLSGNDLVQFWEADPATAVICLYVESIGNARKFFSIARRVGRSKPLVMMRTAGLDLGAGTWPSPDTFSALTAQAGIIETESLAELFDLARLLAVQPLPAGRRVAVLANSPGTAVLGAETLRRCGLTPVPFVLDRDPPGFAGAVASAAHDAVPALPPPFLPAPPDVDPSAPASPVVPSVPAPPAGPEPAGPGSGQFDAVLVVFAQTVEGRTGEVQVAVERAVAARRAAVASPADVEQPRPLLACYLGEPPTTEVCAEGDVPRFRFPEDAARALAHAAGHAEWRQRPPGRPVAFDDVAFDEVRVLVGRVLAGAEPGVPVGLGLDDAMAVLRATGITPVIQEAVSGLGDALAAAARIGYPVALKAARRGRMARSVSTGLALGLHDESEFRAAYAVMAERFGDGFGDVLVQAMAEPGLDVAVVAHHDDRLGPLLAVGRGGALGSAPHELAVGLVPLGVGDAGRLVHRSPLQPLLDRLDGAGALAELDVVLDRLSYLMDQVPEIAEVRLDPVLISHVGLAVTDLAVQVARRHAPAEPPVRRLG